MQVERVQLTDRFAVQKVRSSLVGTLYLTTTHLIFVGDGGGNEIWVRSHGAVG